MPPSSAAARMIARQRVRTGEHVGYGTSYLAQQPATVPVIPVGYTIITAGTSAISAIRSSVATRPR
jgi:hypothetical protein